jgi:hypothetical protein
MSNWKYMIDVADIFHSDRPITSKAHLIALRIRVSDWYANTTDKPWLESLCSDLDRLVNTVWEFDDVWDQVYGQADMDHCLINTKEDHQNERRTSTS